jgi:formylglycine-generating enzyme required for sulfatase activity
VELLVAAGKGIYRYTSVNGKKIYDSDIVLKLEEATQATVFFGTYNLTVNVVGSGSVNTEFIGPDEVTLTAENDQDVFSNFTWGDNSSNYNPLTITMTSDTTVTATFKKVTSKYLVIDISGGPSAISWPYRYTSDAPEVQSNACRTTELWLRYIPAGEFRMGSPESEYGRGTREVAHEVTLTKDFYIGVFELTVKQYKLITGDTVYGGDACPVVDVTFDSLRGTVKGAQWPASDEVDESSFMGIIRAKTGLKFDLPTEAQWEYACRATTTTAFNNGKNLDDEDLNLAEIAYYNAPSSGRINVGSRKPNLWGLYDMHGNVWEWCLDWYTDNLGTDPVVDPVGLDEGTQKTLRGGSFNDGASACRSAYRAHTETDHNMDRLGFRPVVNQ